MSAALLSICITTRNRVKFLGETLDSIVSQLTNDVEVVIVDGASNDGTDQLVAEYQQRFQCIRYFRETENRGLDEGYDFAVKCATGKYCWLFTDDDVLKPGAVAAVSAHLSNNYDMIIANAEVRTIDLKRIWGSSRLSGKTDKIYSPGDFDTFAREVLNHLSFIGGVIIKRNVWMKRNREKYYGSMFVHVGVIFSEPFENPILVMAYPWIQIRYGNASWASRSFEIWMFKWPELVWSFGSISKRAKQIVVPRYPWGNLRFLVAFRARGAFTIREYNQWIAPIQGMVARKLLARLVVAIPQMVANFIRWVRALLIKGS